MLAKVYEINNNLEKANQLLQESLAFYTLKVKDGRYKNNFISTYMLLASNYIKLGHPDKAIKTLEENNQYYPINNAFKKEMQQNLWRCLSSPS